MDHVLFTQIQLTLKDLEGLCQGFEGKNLPYKQKYDSEDLSLAFLCRGVFRGQGPPDLFYLGKPDQLLLHFLFPPTPVFFHPPAK